MIIKYNNNKSEKEKREKEMNKSNLAMIRSKVLRESSWKVSNDVGGDDANLYGALISGNFFNMWNWGEEA